MAKRSKELVDDLLKDLSTAPLAAESTKTFGEVVVVNSLQKLYQLADTYASEHVEIITEEPKEALQVMTNYGALFLGTNNCVSFGDKVSR